MYTEVTVPDYKKMAENLYNLIVNMDVGHYVALVELEYALRHAQIIGETTGYEKGFEDCRQKLLKEYLYAKNN